MQHEVGRLPNNTSVGILALQGDFLEHSNLLKALKVDVIEVRNSRELSEVDSLIIPGGESTTIAKLLDVYDLRQPIIEFAGNGRPVWGTCAGMILLAGSLIEPEPSPLKLMNTVVQRNAFGRQVNSFSTKIKFTGISGGMFEAIFIRAPYVVKANSGVDVLSRLDDDTIVAVRENNLLATAFHPELTKDCRVHDYFVRMTIESMKQNG